MDHDNSERVFHGVEQAVQRAILEDEFKYAVHAIRGENLLALTHTVHGNAPPPLPRAASGRGQGSPKPHAHGSPKRSRLAGSPKPFKATGSKLAVPTDSSGTRTISRGKPRPGSAAAASSNFKGAKTGGSA